MRFRNALWMARRYLFGRRNAHAAFINWASFASLALGVMTLTVVASVMNGFNAEIRTRLLGATPHALAIAPVGTAPAELAALPAPPAGVVGQTRFFAGAAMLSARGALHPLALHAVDLDGMTGLDLVFQAVARGTFTDTLDEPGGIALGEPLARAFGLGLGDAVVLALMTPSPGGGQPRLERFTLRATFAVGAQPDYSLAVVGLADLARRGLVAAGDVGWRLQFRDPMAAPAAAAGWAVGLPGWTVRTWADVHGDLFHAVRLEKTLMFALLALVIAIAAFNIVAGQTMLVADKRADIAMLATMGAPERFLALVFIAQGFTIALAGVAVGLAAGVAIAWNAAPVANALAALSGGSILEGTVYDTLPSEVLAGDLLVIGALALSLCFLAVLRPARHAARAHPAEALHEA